MSVPPHDPHQRHPQQPPPPPQMVPARRGMGFAGHGFNWTLTLCTCGMWLPMYWCWWATVRSWQAWRNMRNRKKYRKVYG